MVEDIGGLVDSIRKLLNDNVQEIRDSTIGLIVWLKLLAKKDLIDDITRNIKQ